MRGENLGKDAPIKAKFQCFRAGRLPTSNSRSLCRFVLTPACVATCPMPRKRPRQIRRSNSRAGSSLDSEASERSSPDVKKEAQTQSRLRVRTTPTISNATTPSRGSKAQILCTNAKGRHVMSVTFRTKNAQLGAKVRMRCCGGDAMFSMWRHTHPRALLPTLSISTWRSSGLLFKRCRICMVCPWRSTWHSKPSTPSCSKTARHPFSMSYPG